MSVLTEKDFPPPSEYEFATGDRARAFLKRTQEFIAEMNRLAQDARDNGNCADSESIELLRLLREFGFDQPESKDKV